MHLTYNDKVFFLFLIFSLVAIAFYVTLNTLPEERYQGNFRHLLDEGYYIDITDCIIHYKNSTHFIFIRHEPNCGGTYWWLDKPY